MSEFLGVTGLAMFAVAVASLWIMRLNKHATSSPSADVMELEEHHVDTTSNSGIFVNLAPPPIIPEDKPSDESKTEAKVQAPRTPKENSKLAKVVTPEQVQPDSEAAAEQLKIAEQLILIGDYEGVVEYANFVSADKDASPKQRAQAENLIRRAKTF